MNRRASSLVSPPNLLSLLRIPLALAVWVRPRRTAWLAELMLAAGLTDILDGWVARLMRGRPTVSPDAALGAWLDPACDKVFAASLAGALYAEHRHYRKAVALAFTREALQVPLFALYAVLPAVRRAPHDYRARRLGKLTTVAQFMTLLSVALERGSAHALSLVTAGLGALSVVDYAKAISRAAGPARPLESAS
jgi:phosphatidylglycerophosphate synthase